MLMTLVIFVSVTIAASLALTFRLVNRQQFAYQLESAGREHAALSVEFQSQLKMARETLRLLLGQASTTSKESTLETRVALFRANQSLFSTLSVGAGADSPIAFSDSDNFVLRASPKEGLVAALKGPNDQVAWGVIPFDRFAALSQKSSSHRARLLTTEGRVVFDSHPSASPSDLAEQLNGVLKLVSGSLTLSTPNETRLANFSRLASDLVYVLDVPIEEVFAGSIELKGQIATLALVLIAAAIMIALWLARSITAPVSKLVTATQQIAKGDFTVTIGSPSHDELGQLGKSFEVMGNRLNQLMTERTEKLRLMKEVEIASNVQQKLLPQAPLRDARVETFAHYRSAEECGGDWWGYIDLGDKILFAIADATGHGLPSALITAAAQSCTSVLRRSAELGRVELTPKTFLSFANRAIFDAASGQILMTCFVACIDPKKNRLTYASAGHPPAWILSGSPVGNKVQPLVSPSALRLGEQSENSEFEETTVEFNSRQSLFLFTDGITEARTKKDGSFGKKRLRDILTQLADRDASTIGSALSHQFNEWLGDSPLQDDVTWVVVSRPG